jgi:hypothetical protein
MDVLTLYEKKKKQGTNGLTKKKKQRKKETKTKTEIPGQERG